MYMLKITAQYNPRSNNRTYSQDMLNKLFREATGQLGIEIELYEATKHSFGIRYVNEDASRDLLKE